MNRLTSLRMLLLAMLLLLAVQYVLGLLVMAYSSPPTADCTTYCSYLDYHYGVGLLAALIAIIVLIFSALTRRVSFVAISLIAFVAIVGADLAGRTRIHSEDEIYSIIMGITFLIAFSSYFWEALAIRKAAMPKPATT